MFRPAAKSDVARGVRGSVRPCAGLWALAALVLALAAPPGRADTAGTADAAPDSGLIAAAGVAPDSSRFDVPANAQRGSDEANRGPYFYTGLRYGSEALVHPLRLIINGGFGILQFDNRTNRLADVRFREGWHRVRADLESPGRVISVNGWNDFLRREVLPISSSRRDAQYWPNYTLHLVGGGMSYVMMREWYEQHAFAHPRVWASATLTTYHVLNEVVEAGNRTERPTTDAIADLLLFDPAGVLMFSHEGVSRFFGNTLHLRDWSNQPAIDPAIGTIENQGQNFAVKLGIPRSEHWSLFYYFGNHGELGLSYRRADGSAFSAGGGLRAKELIDLGNGIETANLVPSYGFFYDRNGSLLCSVTAATSSRYRLRMNVYPGLLRIGGHTAGLFVLLGREGETIAGVHFTGLPIGAAGKVRD